MSALITLRYQFDETGRSPTNLILDEMHSIPQSGHRLIVAREGLFYTPGFYIRPANSSTHLVEGTDYKFVAMDADITALTGIQTATAIEFINPLVFGEFAMTYQAVGGHEGRSNALVEELIEAIENAKNNPIEWTHIQNKPAQYPPEEHWHEMVDITGWEVMVNGLRELQRAIVESRPLHLSSRELHHQDQRILYILCQLRHDLNRISDYMGRFDSLIARLLLEVERLADIPERVEDLERRVKALEDVDHRTQVWTWIEEWHILNGGCSGGDGGWAPSATDIIDMYIVDQLPSVGPGQIALPFVVDCAGEGDVPDTVVGGTTEQPVITTPTDGSQWVNQTPIFTASPFSGVDQNNQPTTHAASYWQIATDPEFTQIRYQSGRSTIHLTELDPAEVNLSLASGSYYLRVGYVSNTNATSTWSVPVQFAVASIEVEAPSITSPVNGDVDVALLPTINASTYTTTGTSGHSATQWQVATDSGFADTVFDVVTTTDLTSITLPDSLSSQTTYYVRARYRSVSNSWSPWSQVNSFTTMVIEPIGQPTIISAVNTPDTMAYVFTASPYAPSPTQPSVMVKEQWRIYKAPLLSGYLHDAQRDPTADQVFNYTFPTYDSFGVQVRYLSSLGMWSEWSPVQMVTITNWSDWAVADTGTSGIGTATTPPSTIPLVAPDNTATEEWKDPYWQEAFTNAGYYTDWIDGYEGPFTDGTSAHSKAISLRGGTGAHMGDDILESSVDWPGDVSIIPGGADATLYVTYKYRNFVNTGTNYRWKIYAYKRVKQ